MPTRREVLDWVFPHMNHVKLVKILLFFLVSYGAAYLIFRLKQKRGDFPPPSDKSRAEAKTALKRLFFALLWFAVSMTSPVLISITLEQRFKLFSQHPAWIAGVVIPVAVVEQFVCWKVFSLGGLGKGFGIFILLLISFCILLPIFVTDPGTEGGQVLSLFLITMYPFFCWSDKLRNRRMYGYDQG